MEEYMISEEEVLRQIAGGAAYPMDIRIMVIDRRPQRNFYDYVAISSRWHAASMKKAVARAIQDHVNNFDLCHMDNSRISYNTTVAGNGIEDGEFIRVIPVTE